MQEILDGQATEENLNLLGDDWNLEERCKEALAHWDLGNLDLNQKMVNLSGGQKTKVFLAGISIHRPDIVLLDEPSNHLDAQSRDLLYHYINTTRNALLVVSHDRKLLNLLPQIFELSKNNITVYGGNYDFYLQQKMIETGALNQELRNKEKTLRKAREIEKEAIERQKKLDARGKKKQEKAGVPAIFMNTLKNKAEKSTSRIKGIHTEKTGTLSNELSQLRKELPGITQMKMDFDNSSLFRGKVLMKAKDINFRYGQKSIWTRNLNFQLSSAERIAIKGPNGSGKTTLIKLILGELYPHTGSIERAGTIQGPGLEQPELPSAAIEQAGLEPAATLNLTQLKAIHIDQDYSLIDNSLTVYQQAEHFNSGQLQEHEIKIRLNRFLFGKDYWDKTCKSLSGGEKMRLMLCSLMISSQAPDLIVLDEPTNNLDIQNIEILTAAVNEYQGTLLVVSHDEFFLKQINIENVIILNPAP